MLYLYNMNPQNIGNNLHSTIEKFFLSILHFFEHKSFVTFEFLGNMQILLKTFCVFKKEI